MRELTDKYIKGLKPPKTGRLEISDTKRVGLRLRVAPTGKKTWIYEKRIKGGMKRKHTLGAFPEVSLSNARATALELYLEAQQGIDRIALDKEKRAERERQALIARARLVTVADAVDNYSQMKLASIKSGKERERQLQMMLCNVMALPTQDLGVEPFRKAIETKIAENKTVMANRLIAASSHFIGWLWRRGDIPEDFSYKLPEKVQELPRDRILSLEEIRAIYCASFELEPVAGAFFRVLILTAQRRGEIATLTRGEIDWQKRVILKASRSVKNKQAHTTHLSKPALESLELAGSHSDSENMFEAERGKFENTIKTHQARLQVLSKVDNWTIHDFRTSFSTAMAEQGEDEAIIDRILNHAAAGSAPSAVARVYNQSKHLPQRARILDKWAQNVTNQIGEVIAVGFKN